MTQHRTTKAPAGQVVLEDHGGWWELILDHPQRRNAITASMAEDLARAVQTLAESNASAVLLRGAGGAAFCAGSDLREVRAGLADRDQALTVCASMRSTLDRLEALPLVRVVAVQGAAFGGGAELMLVGHRIVVGAGARIGFVHARLGLSPGWGGERRLRERVGVHRAVQLLASAAAVDAEQAFSLGLVDTIAPDDEVVERARGWLETVARRPAGAVRAAVALCQGRDPDAGAETFERRWGGAEHRAALEQMRIGREP